MRKHLPISSLSLLFSFVVLSLTAVCAQSDVAPSDDNPVYAAFKQLEQAPAYHTRITMHSNDPQMAQMAAMGMGFSPMEKTVKGGTTQVIMHMKMPAMDMRGAVDDWEIRAVAQNGKVARMFSSPAIPRLKKMQEQSFAIQMALLDKQAGMAIAQALAQGPYGAIRAGMIGAETVAFNIMAERELKKAEEFWNWRCLDQPGGGPEKTAPAQLTDVKAVGDESVNGKAAAAYDFFVNEDGRRNGPVRLLVAKDNGLPLRIHMDDPGGHGSIDMDYDQETTGEIEVPKCLTDVKN
jgi:hypothetical protein